MTYDRLSALDTSFLHLEGPTTPMHISSLGIYEGPIPPPQELRQALAERLHLIPRFRQRVVPTPFNQHRPLWIDDPAFDLDGHLRHIALPAPGTEEQLMELCGSLLSSPLDRTRPLWEMWLIDGLGGGRFAILAKTHHALFDGITGADLHAVLLDPSPQPIEVAHEPWTPGPQPGRAALLADGIKARAAEPFAIAGAFRRALRDPRAMLRRATEIVQGATAYGRAAVRTAPRSPLNEPSGSRRRYEVVRASLAEFRRISKHFDATVNDVVLAAVAGSLRAWFIHRSIVPKDLRVMVPVSVRTPAERGGFGNRVVMFIIPLPVGEVDPVRRLEIVHDTMDREKRSNQVRAEEMVTMLAAFAPPQIVAQLTRIQSLRWFNLLVTNIPGPQFPLYVRGRRLLELFPQAPLGANQGLSVAVMSYDGNMGFGLLADRDVLPDVDVIAREIYWSIRELIDASGAVRVEEAEETAPIPVGVGASTS